MLRNSTRLAIVSVVLLVVATAAYPQLPAHQWSRPSRQAQVATGANRDDPQQSHPTYTKLSMQDAMRQKVNPANRNYGAIFNGWQDTIVQYTIANSIWWFGVVSILLLVSGALYHWWYVDLWAKRQECFVHAAAVLIGQRNTALDRARFAIQKHNELVAKYDLLNDATASAAELVAGIDGAVGVGQAPSLDGVEEAAIILDSGTQSTAIVEKQSTPGEASVYKIGEDLYIKKEDHVRQMEAEQQVSRRIRVKNQQLQDNLFQYEGK